MPQDLFLTVEVAWTMANGCERSQWRLWLHKLRCIQRRLGRDCTLSQEETLRLLQLTNLYQPSPSYRVKLCFEKLQGRRKPVVLATGEAEAGALKFKY